MAARSVKCIFINDSDQRLRLKQAATLDHGIWSTGADKREQQPPREVSPGGRATWESESNGFMTGTEGRAIYEADNGTTLELWWDNPFIGDNKYSLTVRPEGGHAGRYSDGEGDNATVTYTFKNQKQVGPPGPVAPARSAPPPADATLNVQATCGKPVHVSPSPDSKDVMIVPKKGTFKTSSHEGELMLANYRFAQQWLAADLKHRKVLEITLGARWSDFEKIMVEAAKIARGKEIILMTGHGGALGHRGFAESTLDTVPELGGVSEHKHTIDAQKIIEIQNVAKLEGDKLVPIPPNAQSMVDSYDPQKFLGLVKIGRAFREYGVARFTGLTCNVGKDRKFGYAMANLLQTEFRAYQNLVASQQVLGLIQIWIVDDESNPSANQPEHNGDKTHPSFREIPTHGQKLFQPNCP
ncbi:aegerolysin family protein [Polyangium fumosum]|uniref:Uncharacterized protein n=1 Tax=Polyangium fumosum TaxID=889272 RepID=A0A4U1IUT7_9BACT|nr:aegerolysin family protein [Polyangium fumosum]TKC98167.1 hypothetical protein E8A74_42320 [Polyangium fumosum]